MCNFNIGLQVLPFSILSENKDTVLIGFAISASLKFDPCLPGTVFTYWSDCFVAIIRSSNQKICNVK